jgi:hypothetical protein
MLLVVDLGSHLDRHYSSCNFGVKHSQRDHDCEDESVYSIVLTGRCALHMGFDSSVIHLLHYDGPLRLLGGGF